MRDAIKSYLRVTVLYSNFTELTAASFFQLGKVNLELVRQVAADNPAEAAVFRKEAAGNFQTVIDSYPPPSGLTPPARSSRG